MNKIQIITDSASDILLSEAENLDICLVPMIITIDCQEYVDGKDIDKETFYKLLMAKEVYPKTSQPTPQDFLNHFQKAKQNNDEVIVILISSALSGTVQSAVLAKEMVDYDKIYIVDSLLAAAGERILVDIAIKMRAFQKSGLEIYNFLEEKKKDVNVIATINTLEYLYKGGRLSKSQARFGDFLNLKPLISFTSEGKLEVVDKGFGINKAIKIIIKRIEKAPIDNQYPVYFVYAYDNSLVLKLIDNITKIYNINNYLLSEIGPTIGTHVGPSAFGLFYLKKT